MWVRSLEYHAERITGQMKPNGRSQRRMDVRICVQLFVHRGGNAILLAVRYAVHKAIWLPNVEGLRKRESLGHAVAQGSQRRAA